MIENKDPIEGEVPAVPQDAEERTDGTTPRDPAEEAQEAEKNKEIDPLDELLVESAEAIPAVEEAQVVAPPAHEPDGQPELPEEKDLPGVITKLTPKLYTELMRQWVNRGSPRDFAFRGVTWRVYTEGTGGQKFVADGTPGSGIDGDYKSLSIGKI